MDDTASFSSRGNAKRAAEKMIANGTAPAVDYGFKTRDDGRFEIVWKTAPAVAAGDADPFARIRASEEIEALGTTPEKYAAAAPTTAAHATGEGENTVAEFDPATEALDVHKAWQGEQAARDAATGTDWFPGTEGTHFAGVPLADNAAAGAAADAPAPVTEAAAARWRSVDRAPARKPMARRHPRDGAQQGQIVV
jgi:hypothetical protein